MSITFRASSSENDKLQKTYVNKDLIKPHPFFEKTFKKYTYKAIAEKRESFENENTTSTLLDLELIQKHIFIDNNKENEIEETEEYISEKMDKYSDSTLQKANIHLENTMLNYEYIIKKYYCSNNKSKTIEVEKLEKMKEDLVNIETINEDICNKKKIIRTYKESINNINNKKKISNGISVNNNNECEHSHENLIQQKIINQKRIIWFTKLVEKLKNQIIDQKKLENTKRMNENNINNYCFQTL